MIISRIQQDAPPESSGAASAARRHSAPRCVGIERPDGVTHLLRIGNPNYSFLHISPFLRDNGHSAAKLAGSAVFRRMPKGGAACSGHACQKRHQNIHIAFMPFLRLF